METERRKGRFHLPEPKVDETIVEAIKDFPDYDSKNGVNTFVGSKQYWESVFKDETNRDTELHNKFDKLHEDIVDMVIKFCKDNNIDMVDSCNVHIDGIQESIEDGEWTCGTDSSMWIKKFHWEEYNGHKIAARDDNNFLYQF